LHLTLERADGGLGSGQLALQAITPVAEHPQLAFPVMPHGLLGVAAGAATGERGEHGKIRK
jgi:hypothetical protein